MKTRLLKCSSVCVTCLLVLFSFQGNSSSIPPQCPDGYYYTDCVPAAIGLSDPCYPGCAPMPGTQIIFDGINDASKTVKIGCRIQEDQNFCSVICSEDHTFTATEKGIAKHVYTACPVCGSNVFTIEK